MTQWPHFHVRAVMAPKFTCFSYHLGVSHKKEHFTEHQNSTEELMYLFTRIVQLAANRLVKHPTCWQAKHTAEIKWKYPSIYLCYPFRLRLGQPNQCLWRGKQTTKICESVMSPTRKVLIAVINALLQRHSLVHTMKEHVHHGCPVLFCGYRIVCVKERKFIRRESKDLSAASTTGRKMLLHVNAVTTRNDVLEAVVRVYS